jgi:hypothetical protein
MVADDPALHGVAHRPVIPGVMRQKFLKRANRGPRRQSDRFNALARQIRKQPAAIGAQVLESGKPRKALAKAAQELGERRSEPGNLIFGHRPPCLLEVLPLAYQSVEQR